MYQGETKNKMNHQAFVSTIPSVFFNTRHNRLLTKRSSIPHARTSPLRVLMATSEQPEGRSTNLSNAINRRVTDDNARISHGVIDNEHSDNNTPRTRREALRLLFLSALAAASLSGGAGAANARVVVADPDAGRETTRTPSGLEFYDFVRGGEGEATVQSGDRVTVHYTMGSTGARNGWRIDSTDGRAPLVFRVGSGSVVKGLEEGVVGMHVGGRRRLLVPANLGYLSKDDQPIPPGFAEFQRFKNLYLNPNRPFKPDVVFDVTVVRVDSS